MALGQCARRAIAEAKQRSQGMGEIKIRKKSRYSKPASVYDEFDDIGRSERFV
jgi:hypothetical protein